MTDNTPSSQLPPQDQAPSAAFPNLPLPGSLTAASSKTSQAPAATAPDWLSSSGPSDLEELKRKVEQLKAQAFRTAQPAPEAVAPAPASPVFTPTPLASEPAATTRWQQASAVQTGAAEQSQDDDVRPALPSRAQEKFQAAMRAASLPAASTTAAAPSLAADPAPPQLARPGQPLATSAPQLATPQAAASQPAIPQAPSTRTPMPLPSAAAPAPGYATAAEAQPATTFRPAGSPLAAARAASPVSTAQASAANPPASVGGSAVSTAAPRPLAQVPQDDVRKSLRPEPVPKRSGVPFSLFTLTFMWAVSVSTVCGYLVHERINGRPDILESLPDVPVPTVQGHAAYRVVPENAALPPGHELTLGQTRRFGQLEITPTKIEQIPLGEMQDQSQLVLWLKLQNVSADQRFKPLDEAMITMRAQDQYQASILRSNCFVSSESMLGSFEQKALMLSSNDPAAKHAGALLGYFPELGPGEWYETAILCEPLEITEASQDDFHWRLQVRKGLSQASRTPVTTLVEVRFRQKDLSPIATDDKTVALRD